MLPPQQPPYSGIARLLSEPIPLSIPSHGDKKLASAIATCLKEIQCWANLEDGREPLTANKIHFKTTLPGPSAPHSLDQALLDWWSVASMLVFAFRMGLTMRPSSIIIRSNLPSMGSMSPSSLMISHSRRASPMHMSVRHSALPSFGTEN
jgi:hypothetical protein